MSPRKLAVKPQGKTPKKIIVIENTFRLGMGLLLAKILQISGDPSLTTRVIDAEDLLAEMKNYDPDVVVLDIDSLRHSGALNIALEIRESYPEKVIVFMSEGANPVLIREGMLAALWSNAYWLNQPSRYPALVYPEILRAFNGKKQLNSQVLEAAANEAKHIGLLSPQQHRVMRMVATGASNSKIGRECRLTIKAVERTIASASKLLEVEPSSVDTNHRVNAANAYRQSMLFADITGLD